MKSILKDNHFDIIPFVYFFFFFSFAWGDILDKILLWAMFGILLLRFKSLIHFEFIFICGVRRWSTFIFLYISVKFSQHHWLNKLSLAHCMWLIPLSNIIWLWRHGFISGLCILLHWSMCLFLASAMLFWLLWPYSIVWY